MRNDHIELIRVEMSLNNKYTYDIGSLSISDIIALIAYNKDIVNNSKLPLISACNNPYQNNIVELEEYLNEFNKRLSNRTANFKKK